MVVGNVLENLLSRQETLRGAPDISGFAGIYSKPPAQHTLAGTSHATVQAAAPNQWGPNQGFYTSVA